MKFRQTLFWDTDPKKIDVKKNAPYIIERIADFGHDNEVAWVFNFYDMAFIRKVITQSRNISPRTRALWKLLVKKV